MGHRRNLKKKKLESILNWMKMKTQYITLWNAVKVTLKAKFMAPNAYIHKERSSPVNYLNFHHNENNTRTS